MAKNADSNNVTFSLRRLGDRREIEISEKDFLAIKSSKESYFKIIQIEESFEAALEDYAELEETLSHYGIRHLIFFHQAEFQSMRNVINRRLLHLLATSLLYRDGLKKSCKKLLKNAEDGESLRNELRDSARQPLEYRVVEALRNYSQHQQFPISSMSTTSQWEGDDKAKKERGAHFISVNIDAIAIANERDIADDLKDALVKMGPNAELIGYVRKYVEHLGSIHGIFRKLINREEKIWEKTIRDAMNFPESPQSIKGLPLIVYATKKGAVAIEEVPLFDEMFESLKVLRAKNGTQQTLSRRYVRWSGLQP